MSNLRSASRRVLAVAASALIGLAGAAAVASPAQAHHPVVTGEAECPDPDTGEWSVDWTVTSWEESWHDADQYKIIEVTPTPGDSTVEFPVGEGRDMDQAFTGTQVLGGDAEFAQITVKAKWNNENEGDRTSEKIARPDPCEGPETPAPTVAAAQTCDGMVVTATNPDEGEEAEVTLTPSTGEPVTETLPPGGSTEHTFEAGEDGLSVAATIAGEELAVFEWQQPDDCDEPDDGEGGGDEELPETGVPTGAVFLGAGLLLALGGGLFLLARRRRIVFTA